MGCPYCACVLLTATRLVLPPAWKAETGLAAVQLTSDMSVHKLLLDEVAECAGPAEDDDY